MREIKFRAWNTNTERLIEWDEILDEWKQLTWVFASDKMVLMQYTGLKDKNGKEIYEGDVVCYVEDVVVDSEGGFNRTEPEGQIGLVEFSNGAYWVNGKEYAFYQYGEQMFLWSELEIIGNIYENSELMPVV